MKKCIPRFVLFSLLLFFYLSSGAQPDCGCELITRSQCDSLANKNDSSIFKLYIAKLKDNKNVYCKIFEKELQINYLISVRNANFLHLLKQQEGLVNGTACKSKYLYLIYKNYCVYYKTKEDYENFSKYAFQYLAYAEDMKDKVEEISALQNIVHLFTRQDEHNKIPAYVSRARKLIYSLPQSEATPDMFNWVGMNYESLYTFTNNKKYLDTSSYAARSAIAASLKHKDYLNVVQAHRVFEAVSYHRGDFRSAIIHIDSAIAYLKQVNMKVNPTSLYLSKAWDYADLKLPQQAMQWLDTGLHYSTLNEPGTIGQSSAFLTASQLYEQIGETEKAFGMFKQYQHLKDSLFDLSRSETINDLEQKYFKARNEKTIKELAQERKIYLLLIGMALLGLIALVFFIRQQALRNKQKIVAAEQRLNRARMNPHFFFNALSSIQSFALQGHDGLSIASNISKFSHIMRETLESTYKEYVTIEQETDFLNEYLELQKMRFPEKYEYEISCSEDIDPDEVLLPSMILQPFVENSIEHGFVGLTSIGQINIDFTKEGNVLLIRITDNGKGLTNEIKENNEHISRAGQIIKDRIYLLNLKLKTAASFSIDNRKESNGVLVLIRLPYLEKSKMTS